MNEKNPWCYLWFILFHAALFLGSLWISCAHHTTPHTIQIIGLYKYLHYGNDGAQISCAVVYFGFFWFFSHKNFDGWNFCLCVSFLNQHTVLHDNLFAFFLCLSVFFVFFTKYVLFNFRCTSVFSICFFHLALVERVSFKRKTMKGTVFTCNTIWCVMTL